MMVDEYIAVLASQGAGEDLEYDPVFIALVNEVASKEDAQYGDYVYIPEPVDWASVETKCKSLFERTLDFRVAVSLTRAWLERDGLLGLTKGLSVLVFLVRERWEDTYPRLSREDQFDSLERINILAELAVPSTVIARLRQEVLVCLPSGETLSCADLDLIASGGESDGREECLKRLESQIEPQCSIDLMRALSALNRVKGLLDNFNQCLDEHTGLCEVSPLHPLSRLIQQWIQVVDSRLRRTVPAVSSAPGPDMAQPVAGVALPVGGCRSREEVIRALDAIAAYYTCHEPSSPIPMLVQRVRRLAGMDFLEIMAELAPSSVSDMRALAGIQED